MDPARDKKKAIPISISSPHLPSADLPLLQRWMRHLAAHVNSHREARSRCRRHPLIRRPSEGRCYPMAKGLSPSTVQQPSFPSPLPAFTLSPLFAGAIHHPLAANLVCHSCRHRGLAAAVDDSAAACTAWELVPRSTLLIFFIVWGQLFVSLRSVLNLWLQHISKQEVTVSCTCKRIMEQHKPTKHHLKKVVVPDMFLYKVARRGRYLAEKIHITPLKYS